MSQETNIRQLVINKLTDAQYEQAVKNADELYLTPDSGSGGGTDLPDQTGQSGKFLTTNGSTLSWGSVPAGTVTSVQVQAGTGLTSSTSTAQNTTLSTTISIASGYKLPTTTEWNNNALPSQSGNEGKFLTTNGSTTSWADASIEIDNSTIVENSTNQIQTVGVKDVRTDNTIKTWTGTKSQYDALIPTDWTVATQDNNLKNYNYWDAIAYDGTKFLILDDDGHISTSTDGTTWSTVIQSSELGNADNHWYNLCYDGTKFVAISKYGSTCYISTSTDGTTWATPTIISNLTGRDNGRSLAYGNGKYIFMNDDGNISISTDGITWSNFTETYLLMNCPRLIYADNKFITLSSQGYVFISTDGTNWTSTQSANLNGYQWYNIGYDGSKFIAVSYNSYVSTSTNGIDWTAPTHNSNLNSSDLWGGMAYDGSKFVIVSSNGYVSTKARGGEGVDSNTLYNVENNGIYLGVTPIADIGGGGSGDLPDPTGQSGKFLSTNGTTFSWETPPQGTVTSVRVQADTGLSSSQSTAQSSVLNTTISIASGYKLPTTTEWNNKQDTLPSQTGQSGKYLTTNGTTMSWATVGSGGSSDYNDLTNKPSINSITLSGNKTGSDLGLVDEEDLEELDINNIVPEQTGNSGKFLTTNGSTVAWATVQGGGGSLPDQTGQSGKFLTTNGTTASWANTTAVKFRDWSAS